MYIATRRARLEAREAGFLVFDNLRSVLSIYSEVLALGTIPVIRCPKNGAAEYVSKKLDKKLRENLRDTRNSLFLNEGGMQGGGQFSFHRPLLVRHFLNLRGVSGKHFIFGVRDFKF